MILSYDTIVSYYRMILSYYTRTSDSGYSLCTSRTNTFQDIFFGAASMTTTFRIHVAKGSKTAQNLNTA